MVSPPHPRQTQITWRWLWAACALAVGLFIAPSGWAAWVAGPVVIFAGLIGISTRARWSQLAIWIGLGLTIGAFAGLALHVAQADSLAVERGWSVHE